eukprot:5356104-Prymnesium_polylepis.1
MFLSFSSSWHDLTRTTFQTYRVLRSVRSTHRRASVGLLHRHTPCQLRDRPEAIGLDALPLFLGERGILLGLAAPHRSLLPQRELPWKLGAIRVRQCENEALSLQALVDVLD